jgi:hypothetical protein
VPFDRTTVDPDIEQVVPDGTPVPDATQLPAIGKPVSEAQLVRLTDPSVFVHVVVNWNGCSTRAPPETE